MSATSHLLARVGFTIVFAGLATAAPRTLFPEPLHITREVSLSSSAPKAIVDEYCYGNRVVSVSGKRTAIVDHEKGEMTVIDFGAATYSIAKFEELAAANGRIVSAKATTPSNDWHVEARGSNVVASRAGETIEAERKSDRESHHIRVTVDRQLMLTRGAVEALMGLSYPNARDATADVILGAMRAERSRIVTSSAASSDSAEYRLPLEYAVRSEVGGESIEARYVVIRVGTELPPPDKITIPAGAKRVDSDAVAARRSLEELDRLPLPENPR